MNTNRSRMSLWRNLGIIAHVDAGKTTLTERLLLKAGAIHRVGEVHDGTATTDFSPIEQTRGITITAAAVQIHWTPEGQPEHRLTLIDTPGHIDFAIEVERSLRVLDGAVAVFSAAEGVQPQSETVWRQARRHGVPLLAFVNKMDRIGASFEGVLEQMRAKLGANPWPLVVPIGSEAEFVGCAELVSRTLVLWDGRGASTRRAWTSDEAARYAGAREQLVETVAGSDELLAAAFIEGREVSDEELRAAIRRGTLAGFGVPVLAGAAFRFKGIECLLDAVVDYLPSPLDRPAVTAEGDGGELELAADPSGPLAALLFKTINQSHSPVAFVRVYSGTMKVGDSVWCASAGRSRRIGRLAVIQADKTRDVGEASAGEIVAVLGWKDAMSGETLSGVGLPLRLEGIQSQPAVLSWRLTAERKEDLIRLSQGLASLAQEDPSFRVETDPESGETLAWGMGELHLDVMVERLRTEWKVGVRTGSPSVAYQETPARTVRGVEGKLAKQGGGQGQFARVVLDVDRRSDGEIEFVDRATGGVLPKAFVHATEKGVRAALLEGPRGYPVVGITVVLVDGEIHAVDSSEIAFHRAAGMAIRSALAQAGTILLEPIMALAIDTPAANVGDVVGDLQRRAGRVLAIEDKGARVDVSAQAPLSRLQGYTTTLRSLTQGRGSASLVFRGYEEARTQ